MTSRYLTIVLAILFACKTQNSIIEAKELDDKTPASNVSQVPCDFDSFVEIAKDLQSTVKSRRVDATTFRELTKKPNTIILDARDKASFDALRVKGSVNLPYTLFSQDLLQKTIPDKSTTILIYCRNNLGSYDSKRWNETFGLLPEMEMKGRPAGLNIPTFITLHVYGYRNVWELNTIEDPFNSVLDFDGTVMNPSSP